VTQLTTVTLRCLPGRCFVVAKVFWLDLAGCYAAASGVASWFAKSK